jgi:hypothetical protein
LKARRPEDEKTGKEQKRKPRRHRDTEEDTERKNHREEGT